MENSSTSHFPIMKKKCSIFLQVHLKINPSDIELTNNYMDVSTQNFKAL